MHEDKVRRVKPKSEDFVARMLPVLAVLVPFVSEPGAIALRSCCRALDQGIRTQPVRLSDAQSILENLPRTPRAPGATRIWHKPGTVEPGTVDFAPFWDVRVRVKACLSPDVTVAFRAKRVRAVEVYVGSEAGGSASTLSPALVWGECWLALRNLLVVM